MMMDIIWNKAPNSKTTKIEYTFLKISSCVEIKDSEYHIEQTPNLNMAKIKIFFSKLNPV